MARDERKSPNSEPSVRVESPVRWPMEISPETLELLRSAAIPSEFLKIAREFTPRTEALLPVVPEDFPASAEIEGPFTERPVLEIPDQPEWKSVWQEISVESGPEMVDWLEMPVELIKEEPPGSGTKIVMLTDLTLDLSGVAHSTPGLGQWESLRLGRIVTNTYPVLLQDEGEGAPGEEPDDEEPPPEELRAPPCHCQGGRLAIVIGDGKKNTTIRSALNWVETATKKFAHLHAVYFEERISYTPSLNRPRFFPGAEQPWRDCCYYDEVVIFAHGSQADLYRALARFLPKFLDRPVKKLVFWVCGGNRENYPFTDKGRLRHFQNICHLVRPPLACPCGCVHARCNARSADGAATKCPDPGTPTIVLSAGYFQKGRYTYPSNLGLDTTRPDQPFVAPDARLIETTVARSDGDARLEPRAVTDASVFGSRVRSDDSLKPKQPPKFDFNPDLTILPAEVTDPGTALAPYQGSKRNAALCPAADGCRR